VFGIRGRRGTHLLASSRRPCLHAFPSSTTSRRPLPSLRTTPNPIHLCPLETLDDPPTQRMPSPLNGDTPSTGLSTSPSVPLPSRCARRRCAFQPRRPPHHRRSRHHLRNRVAWRTATTARRPRRPRRSPENSRIAVLVVENGLDDLQDPLGPPVVIVANDLRTSR
jgi:hypothetical protein